METEEFQRLRKSWQKLPERAVRIKAKERFERYFGKDASALIYKPEGFGSYQLKWQMREAYEYSNYSQHFSAYDLEIESAAQGKFVHTLKYAMDANVHKFPTMLKIAIEFANLNRLGKRELKRVVRHLKKESEKMYQSAYETYKSLIESKIGFGAPSHLKGFEEHKNKIDALEELVLELEGDKK